MLGDLGVEVRAPWFGQRAVAAARFVGRTPDMWRVHSALTAGEAALSTGARGDPAVKLAGLGGIGKSLLAAEYAMRFASAYPGGVYWLRAHGHDQFGPALSEEDRVAERDAQMLGFARDLRIDTRGLTAQHVSAAVARVLDQRGQPFLWIVDDLPHNLSREQVDGWLSPGRFGHTLVTTRSRSYSAFGAQIEVPLLSADEGVELLARHVQPADARETEAARGLVDDLGGHPLALDVAGAALAAARGVRSIAEYREALSRSTQEELELAAQLAEELPTGHERSIATTLARSIELLNEGRCSGGVGVTDADSFW